MANEKILVVDDDYEINQLIKFYLEKEFFQVYNVFNGTDAIRIVKNEKPDLIILDIMLHDIDGIELCLTIRRETDAPILFLSCKSEELDKILALSVGGDDYLTKPFLPGELIARIKAHLRRNRMLTEAHQKEEIISFANVDINFSSREVMINGRSVNFPAKEFDILEVFVKNPKRVYSPEQIYEKVWKEECMPADVRTIMVYISNIRKKIEKDPSQPKYIINVRGVGYKFNSTLLKK